MRRLRLVLFLCAAALLAPAPAVANHNSDQHSGNVRLDWAAPYSGHTSSDVAAWGNIVVSGNYDGFRIFDMSLPPNQRLLATKLCRGPQNDVSLWEHNGRMLLFLSNDTPQLNGDTTCGTSGNGTDRSPCSTPSLCFEGIRIFDITNPTTPTLIRAVYTICGSHTHTLVPDPANNRVLLYISSAGAQGGPCQPPHDKISIVGVPLDQPETASVIATPPLNILPPHYGSFHGCHDITVYMAIHKAAASCQSEGQIWDISNPAQPDTMNPIHVDTSGVNYWHSAAFTWDGQYVVWDDESFTGRCAPGNDGQIRIWRMADQTFTATYLIPRSQGSAYCSVHNGNIIPVLGRYLFVAGWYAGGTSIIDFTNPSAPHEVGYYDASVGGSADTWSTYWYNGSILANDITRGLDVYQTITAWSPYGLQWDHLNAQTQEGDLFPPLILSSRSTPPGRLLPGGPGELGPARAAKSRSRSTARARGSLWRSRVR